MRNIYIKLLLLCLILMPIRAYAESGSISANCSPTSANPGSTINCTVTVNSDVNVFAVQATVNLGSGATITGFQKNGSWQGNGPETNNNQIDLYDEDGSSGSFAIGTLTIKINDNASAGNVNLGFSNVILTNNTGNEFNGTGGNTSVTITIPSTSTPTTSPTPTTEKGLRTLDCTSGGVLTPPLSDGNPGYSIILDSPSTTTFTIVATPKNPSDSITYQYINGSNVETINPTNITFKTSGGQSAMLIKIRVGSGANQADYTITVTKPVSEKGRLATLTVGGKSVSLSPNKFDYQITLDSVNSYQINATVLDSSKFEVSSPNVGRVLSGEGAYEIVVKPRDNNSGYESGTYIIAVSKKGSSAPVTPPTAKPTPSNNPPTGEGGIILMGIVLVVSLMITLYLYKRNTAEYTK